MATRQDYIEFLLNHYEQPRNRGRLDPADVTMRGGNPGCGDVIAVTMRIDPEALRVTEIAHEGEGCTISQAAASVVSELILGKTLAEIQALSSDALLDVLGREVVQSRLRCATLALHTARAAVRKYQTERLKEQIEADRISEQARKLGLEFE